MFDTSIQHQIGFHRIQNCCFYVYVCLYYIYIYIYCAQISHATCKKILLQVDIAGKSTSYKMLSQNLLFVFERMSEQERVVAQ